MPFGDGRLWEVPWKRVQGFPANEINDSTAGATSNAQTILDNVRRYRGVVANVTARDALSNKVDGDWVLVLDNGSGTEEFQRYKLSTTSWITVGGSSGGGPIDADTLNGVAEDTAATNNTIVKRTSTGGVNATAIAGTTGTFSSTLSSAGLSGTTATFSGAVGTGAFSATTGTFSSTVSATGFTGSGANVTNVKAISLKPAVTVVTSSTSYTILTTDYLIIVNQTSAGPIDLNLPASPTTGMQFVIKDGKGDALTNPITIVPDSETIDGEANIDLSNNYGTMTVTFNGTEWNIS